MHGQTHIKYINEIYLFKYFISPSNKTDSFLPLLKQLMGSHTVNILALYFTFLRDFVLVA